MKFLKLISLFIVVSSIASLKSVNKDDLISLNLINKGDSSQLIDKIQRLGYALFGGENGLTNLLSDNPVINVLNEDDLESWKAFLLNVVSWVQLSKFNAVKTSQFKSELSSLLSVSDIDIIGNYSEIINQKSLKKELFKTLVRHSLESVTSIFLDNYRQLLSLVKKFPHKSEQAAVDAYKKESKNTNFSLEEFFDYYKKTFEINKDQSKERNIVIALTAFNVLDGDETYEMQQAKVTSLINLLEELLYQPKGYFSKKLLTKEQMQDAYRIVSYLYWAYPAAPTYTTKEINKATLAQSMRPHFILWNAARVLMVTLRAYLRKAEII